MLDRLHWSVSRPNSQSDGPEPSLFSILGLITFAERYSRFVIGFVGISLLAAMIYLMGATPLYRARAQLLIESKVPHSFIEQISEAMVALDTPQVESQLAVLRSEQIAELVVRRFGLIDDPELTGRIPSWSLFGFQSRPVEAKPAAGETPPDEAVDPEKLRMAIAGLQSRMDVRRVGLSYAIDITYTSSDPANAARIANAIADGYVEDRLRVRAQSARQGSEWLEERIADIRRQMNSAALDVQEFRARRDYRIIGRGDRPAATTEGEARTDTRITVGPGASSQGPGGASAPGTSAQGAMPAPPPKDAQTLEELEARAHTFRKIYESYLQGYAESVQRQSFPVTNDRVITRATKPERKSSPQRMLILAGTAILSSMFAVGIALVIHSVGDIKRLIRDEIARERDENAKRKAGTPVADPVE